MTRVAIVEDNKVIRESLVDFVQADPDCECVCTCATAEEAMRTLPKHPLDVVLMDIQLPDYSGIECTRQLKQRFPKVQIIMVTVYEDTDRIFRALRAGACGYLLKRCGREQLTAAIREVRQGGAPMTPEIARKVIASFQDPIQVSSEVEDLSRREREILELLAQGFPNKAIASRLGVTDGTIRWHLRHVYDKLHVRSRTEALLKYQTVKHE
jgi:DNA-binding NarL/FixJ family response regulator